MNSSQEAYKDRFQQLFDLCDELTALNREEGFTDETFQKMLLLSGAITAACANIYNLAPPAGFLHPSALFRKE